MDPEKTAEILKAMRGDAQAGEDCLAPEQLAAYLDGGLCAAKQAEAQGHLADCDYCLGQVALLTRSREDSTSASVPPSVAARALAVGDYQVVARRRRFTGWALAAMVVLAVGLFSVHFQPNSPALDSEPYREVRSVDPDAMNPRLLSPLEGSVISPLDQVFRWNEVQGTLYYDVRLVDPEGNLVLRERLETTRWLIPDSVRLEPGEEYFVRIDAYLSDAKFFSSEHVFFTVVSSDRNE